MKHPIRRRLMYLGFRGLQALAQILPLSAGRAIGRALGVVAYRLLWPQRRLAIAHLERALGGSLSPGQRRRVSRGVFVNLGQTAMEWLRLPSMSTGELQRLISAEGLERLRHALAQRNGVIMVTPHLGNWELIPLYLRSLGFEGGVLARRLRYPEYESFLLALRGSRGVPTFARGSLKEIAKLLRANQIVGMLPDQDVESLEGIFVDFFDHPAYTPIGPAALSLMAGAPIVPCFMIRERGGFRLVLETPLQAPQTSDRTAAMAALTGAWSQVFESYIRRYPDQWVWMHRRWKTRPPAVTGHRSPVTGHQATDMRPSQPAMALLVAGCLALVAGVGGCANAMKPTAAVEEPAPARADTPAATPDPNAAQQMSAFTLTGYEEDGTKRWVLDGAGASVDGQIVTIHHPTGVGYDADRTAYLSASAAQVQQPSRHVRLEHDVTIHTSDGVWLAAPILHWRPDRDEVATDTPVRIETDHMLLRGRGAIGLTQLKQMTLLEDIELVLNPTDQDGPGEGRKHVTITCDGPLAFDYENHIATFEQNVHVQDPTGDLYSDKLIAYLSEATHTIRYAEAIGRVRIVQNQNTALSDRAVYEPTIGKITLVGKPSLLVYPSQTHGTEIAFGGLVPATAGETPSREAVHSPQSPPQTVADPPPAGIVHSESETAR